MRLPFVENSSDNENNNGQHSIKAPLSAIMNLLKHVMPCLLYISGGQAINFLSLCYIDCKTQRV